MKRVLSGIQPSGEVHIGNYLGAIKRWVDEQDEHENLICIVDLHAITVPQDPKELRSRTLELAKLLLACGIDPKKTTLFKQSDVAAHSELAWILNTVTHMGELSRMTQFKDKSRKGGADTASVGLFDYPVLMAADILLYDTDLVPVGDDQKQHLELTRNLAERFNNRFGKTFKLPEPKIDKALARIMGLDDPAVKMSKSAGANNYLALLDDDETITRKIKRALTDSGTQVVYDQAKPALGNLLNIYGAFTGVSAQEAAHHFIGKGYADLKRELAEVVVAGLKPIQDRYAGISDKEAQAVLEEGAKKASKLAAAKLAEVKRQTGLA